MLNTNDVTTAMSNYRDLFGWVIAESPSLGPHGTLYEFSWSVTAQELAGAMADIAGRPLVHPHWLFFFEVAFLDFAMTAICRAGGTAMDPVEGPSGVRISICEDPQRAAFGLLERRANRG